MSYTLFYMVTSIGGWICHIGTGSTLACAWNEKSRFAGLTFSRSDFSKSDVIGQSVVQDGANGVSLCSPH